MSNKISFKKLLLKEILPQFIVGLILIFLGFAVIFFLLILLFREGLGGFALIGAPIGFGLLVTGFLSTISASKISGWRKILASLLIVLPAIILCLLMMVAGFAEDLSDLPGRLSQAGFLKVLTSSLALIVPPFIPGIILGWYSYLEGIKKFLIKTVILTVLTLIAIMIAFLLYYLLISEAKMSARDINRRTAMENIKVAPREILSRSRLFSYF